MSAHGLAAGRSPSPFTFPPRSAFRSVAMNGPTPAMAGRARASPFRKDSSFRNSRHRVSYVRPWRGFYFNVFPRVDKGTGAGGGEGSKNVRARLAGSPRQTGRE